MVMDQSLVLTVLAMLCGVSGSGRVATWMLWSRKATAGGILSSAGASPLLRLLLLCLWRWGLSDLVSLYGFLGGVRVTCTRSATSHREANFP